MCIAVPGALVADGAASSLIDRCHSLRPLDSATGGAPITPPNPLGRYIFKFQFEEQQRRECIHAFRKEVLQVTDKSVPYGVD